MFGEKRKLQVLGNIWSRHRQLSNENFKKGVPRTNAKASQNQAQESYQRDKQLGCPLFEILVTIMDVGNGRAQVNRPEDKKPMTMHQALHLNDRIAILHVSRKEGGRGLATIEDSVDVSIRGLKDCIKNSKKRLIMAPTHSTEYLRSNRRKTKTGKQKWEGKQLHGYFNWQINKISCGKILIGLQKGKPERKTESVLIEEQNNAIRTNYIKAKDDNTQ